MTKLAAKDPTAYKTHPRTRFASIYKAITQTVPQNPDHPDFRLGKTLGSEYAEVFKRMLHRGEVPASIADLLHESARADAPNGG